MAYKGVKEKNLFFQEFKEFTRFKFYVFFKNQQFLADSNFVYRKKKAHAVEIIY